MEVHHHPHTERKKWTHYFWEFLMLFLAVFCGFLAENIREHMIEKERGNQYIHSFYEDLLSDTIKMSNTIDYDVKKINALDNMSYCFEMLNKNKDVTICLVEIIKNSMIFRGFHPNERTLKQLENAGGFRLLNNEDADSIIKYRSQFAAYNGFETTVLQSSQDNVRNTFNSIADYRTNARLNIVNRDANAVEAINDKIDYPIFLINDKLSINKFFNELLLYKRVTALQQQSLEALKYRAKILIIYLKNKYHLE